MMSFSAKGQRARPQCGGMVNDLHPGGSRAGILMYRPGEERASERERKREKRSPFLVFFIFAAFSGLSAGWMMSSPGKCLWPIHTISSRNTQSEAGQPPNYSSIPSIGDLKSKITIKCEEKRFLCQ